MAASAAGVFLAAVPGCAVNQGGGSGLRGYGYSWGELSATVPESLDRATSAAVAAAEDQQVTVREREQGDGWARVAGEEGSGRSVTIRLARVTDAETRVRIKVGALGNEGTSRTLLERMRYGLAVAP
jgi:hypothetical protein